MHDLARPLCPITGEPAVRRIQGLSSQFLKHLWRWAGGVDVARLFDGIERLTLWESACGLAFFDPPVAGDGPFYDDFYRRIGAHGCIRATSAERSEYRLAGAHVEPGMEVLDVGCGGGAFADHVRHARYCGVDPYVAPDEAGPGVRREPIEDHVASHREAYDVVCAFQVIEHVVDPKAFVGLMLQALRPGGRLILGVPLWPSPMTEVPNFIINCPPHHLTWWTESAFEALCAAHKLDVVALERPASYGAQDRIQWVQRMSPVKARGPYFRNRVGWHASLAVGYGLGSLWHRMLGAPKGADPIDLLLVARKP